MTICGALDRQRCLPKHQWVLTLLRSSFLSAHGCLDS